jgi:TATA-box binding protein (TBP) (component of TFIID and TFIIIB)
LEPSVHACVNIKYNYKNIDTISIFVFEKGSIIITGAKNRDHLFQSYKFISKFLYENYGNIVKNDIGDIIDFPEIQELIKNRKIIKN